MRALILAVLALVWASSAFAQEPEAVLMSMTGEVVIVSDDGATRAGTFGMHLYGGEVVQTRAESSAEIFFSAGNWIEIGAQSNMSIRGSRAAGNAPAAGAGKPLQTVQRFLQLKDSGGTSSVAALRSGGPRHDLVLVSPCQTKVRAGRPAGRSRNG